jgi:hypothetical protein
MASALDRTHPQALDVADALDLLQQAFADARATLTRQTDRAAPGVCDLAFSAAIAAEVAALRAIAESDALLRETRGWQQHVRCWCDGHRSGPTDHPARRAALEALDQISGTLPALVYCTVIGLARGRRGALDAGRHARAWLETALDAEQLLLATAPHDVRLVELMDATDDLRRALDARCLPTHT